MPSSVTGCVMIERSLITFKVYKKARAKKVAKEARIYSQINCREKQKLMYYQISYRTYNKDLDSLDEDMRLHGLRTD